MSGRMLSAEGEGVRSKGSGSTNYMQELLKIEKKYNQLVGACPDANNNASAHSINFPPCNTKKRRFIYEYGRYYAVLNFEFDESPNRYVNAGRQMRF